jgi:hypothetical protein
VPGLKELVPRKFPNRHPPSKPRGSGPARGTSSKGTRGSDPARGTSATTKRPSHSEGSRDPAQSTSGATSTSTAVKRKRPEVDRSGVTPPAKMRPAAPVNPRARMPVAGGHQLWILDADNNNPSETTFKGLVAEINLGCLEADFLPRFSKQVRTDRITFFESDDERSMELLQDIVTKGGLQALPQREYNEKITPRFIMTGFVSDHMGALSDDQIFRLVERELHQNGLEEVRRAYIQRLEGGALLVKIRVSAEEYRAMGALYPPHHIRIGTEGPVRFFSNRDWKEVRLQAKRDRPVRPQRSGEAFPHGPAPGGSAQVDTGDQAEERGSQGGPDDSPDHSTPQGGVKTSTPQGGDAGGPPETASIGSTITKGVAGLLQDKEKDTDIDEEGLLDTTVEEEEDLDGQSLNETIKSMTK